MKSILTVCARGGSKGVKGKNIRPMLGLPLICYTLRQAKEANLFDAYAVSSDSDQILEVAKREGFLTIKRPEELATDTAAKIPVIRHAVQTAEKILNTTFDICIDLDCTNPLRTAEDIKTVFEMIKKAQTPNVITAMPARRSPYFNLVEMYPGGEVNLAKKLEVPIVRRQDAPSCFDMNGAIYAWKKNVLMEEDKLFLKGTALHVMPEERSFDIDSELDFEIVQMLLSKKVEAHKLNPFTLKGKNAVITGATGILGTPFSHAIATQGANLALIDLDSNKLKALKEELSQKYSVKVETYVCDVSNQEMVSKIINHIDNEFGGIHILHNNAASKGKNLDDFFQPFEEFKLETWKDIMSVNIDGMFLMAQAVGKKMIDRNIQGSIIQTSSIYGVVAPDQRIYEGSYYMNRAISSPAVYSASKAAVIGLTKYLASYWADKGIRVNTLTPGGVESGQNDIFQSNYVARIPLGRMAQADEICGALVYLASDASSYVTGQNLIVDGGLTAW